MWACPTWRHGLPEAPFGDGMSPLGAWANNFAYSTRERRLLHTVTELLRQQRVVGKVVEVFGSGAESLAVTDRLTVANMAPECGATCILFSVDSRTLQYLQMTGREKAHVERVEVLGTFGFWGDKVRAPEEYYRASGLFGAAAFEAVTYSSVTHLDLASVVPCMAGPKRPQDRIPLGELKKSFHTALTQPSGLWEAFKEALKSLSRAAEPSAQGHSGFGLDPDSLGPKANLRG
ncbi:acoA [Symbiodinium sp. KB8]|nr:acoA [Symbiodinium sp. KB8]